LNSFTFLEVTGFEKEMRIELQGQFWLNWWSSRICSRIYSKESYLSPACLACADSLTPLVS